LWRRSKGLNKITASIRQFTQNPKKMFSRLVRPTLVSARNFSTSKQVRKQPNMDNCFFP
jgi:hypothetical protein